MPPKGSAAEKKPAAKAPAQKAPAEKKDAGKKTAASGDKKKRTKTRKETYSSYIYKGKSVSQQYYLILKSRLARRIQPRTHSDIAPYMHTLPIAPHSRRNCI